jgi:outer membrane protein TolC
VQKILCSLLVLSFIWCSHADAAEPKFAQLSLNRYLDIVKSYNAEINNASLDIQTSDAIKESQSLYRFSPSVSYIRGGYQNQTPYATYAVPQSSTYALAFNVEGWGKRTARENLASAQKNSTLSDLESTSNRIQTAAIYAYVDLLRLSLMGKSYQTALSKLGSSKASSRQQDAQRFLASYQAAAEKDLQLAAFDLLDFSGDGLQDLPYPIGNLNIPVQKYDLEELIAQAQNNRMDVLSLQSSIAVADKSYTLVMKNRNVDVAPYIAQTRTPQYQYTNGVSYTVPASPLGPAQTLMNPGTTYTAQNQMTVGITIPIPINNYLQSADIVDAANLKLKYENNLRELKTQIRMQVSKASIQYGMAKESLINAQNNYQAVVNNPSKDPIDAIMNIRDKEGALLDAKTNHVKALVNLWRKSGNYSVPSL